ncbi:MAG: hypothetical protein BAJATHORv1_90096, partial [Candidatus Thorarchaeota archaeon]
MRFQSVTRQYLELPRVERVTTCCASHHLRRLFCFALLFSDE